MLVFSVFCIHLKAIVRVSTFISLKSNFATLYPKTSVLEYDYRDSIPCYN